MNVQLIISCSSKVLAFGSFGDFDSFFQNYMVLNLKSGLNYYTFFHLNDTIVAVGYCVNGLPSLL